MKSEKKTYLSPTSLQLTIKSEGILCESSENKEGSNEAYNSWSNYENDGWH